MRVLLVPELYRRDDATANGTLNDLVPLVERWLALDESMHVYWLLSPRELAQYDAAYVLADRDRVTLIEAAPYMSGDPLGDEFSETGYTEEQLRALRAAIADRIGYVDVAVTQLVTGTYDFFKWLLLLGGHPHARVQPTHLITYVHDFRVPFKRHGGRYPNGTPTKAELQAATVSDGLWFKAGVDADRMVEYGSEYLRANLLESMRERAVVTNSPMALDRFDERYADEPRVFHVAGSGWAKKNVGALLDVGERLHEAYGIRTLMTNMDPIDPAFAARPFVDARPECTREEYEAALREGDIVMIASDHETLARTPFEQAASGQVLLLRDRPWIYDCVPRDHPLIGVLEGERSGPGDDDRDGDGNDPGAIDRDGDGNDPGTIDRDEDWTANRATLGELAVWAVEHWDEAVAANRRLVDHVARVRDPDRAARRTLDDLRRRVETRTAAYPLDEADRSVERAVESLRGDRVALDELSHLAASFDDENRPALDVPGYTVTDLVYALRGLGYRDVGNPGTPVFEPADRQRDPSASAEASS